MDGWLRSRRTTSVHSSTTRCTAVGLNAYALGISSQTSRPSRSHHARKRGSSIFWWMRIPLNPNDFTASTSARSASSSGAARCDSGQ